MTVELAKGMGNDEESPLQMDTNYFTTNKLFFTWTVMSSGVISEHMNFAKKTNEQCI